MNEQHHEYTTGAKRSEKLPAFRYIPAAAITAEARAFSLGAKNYEKLSDGSPSPLTSNWRQGDLQFFLDAAEHLTNHVVQANDKLLHLGLAYLRGEELADLLHRKDQIIEELGHARANTAMLIEWLDAGVAHQHFSQETERVLRDGVTETSGPLEDFRSQEEIDEQAVPLEPVEVPVTVLETPGKFAELVKKFKNTFVPAEDN